MQDLKFAIRVLRKDLGFAVTAVATLALCLGANTALFGIIHAVLLRPLPFPQSDQILLLYNSYPNAGAVRSSTGAADYYDRLRELTVFEEQALYNDPTLTIGVAGSAEQVQGMNVTPSFFRLLRIEPQLGRNFTDEEGEIGHHRKVILSHGLWQKHFGGEGSVLGRDLVIYGNPYTVVGVMPEGFTFLDPDVALWRPLAFTPEQKEARHSNAWEMIGRLKPGATLQQAQAQIDALNAGNLDRFPEFKELLINAGFHTRVAPLQDEFVRPVRSTLYLLWGSVLFVLLIASVNIAGLLLARSGFRARELAVRLALGAGGWRIARQLMTESLLLSALSTGLGLLLGVWTLRALTALGLARIPRGTEIEVDGTVVLFMVALAALMGLAIGSLPVLQALRVNLSGTFRGQGWAVTGGRGIRFLRRSLVAAQVALALVLLFGAGLLLVSFLEVNAIEPGFEAAGVWTGSVALPAVRYPEDAQILGFADRVLQAIRSLPGVISAGFTDSIPFGSDFNDSVLLAEGYQMQPGESLISPQQISVSPGYFETMKIPLLEGRLFDGRDTADSMRVLVIDRRLARKFWPESSPIGRRMWRPSGPEDLVQPGPNVVWYTVVGVVESVKHRALVDPDARIGTYYAPLNQRASSGLTLVARTSLPPSGAGTLVRRAVTRLDPQLPVFDVRTMEERIEESLVGRRSSTLMALGFGLTGLLLAAVGIYGVLAYMVVQRHREIGLRMALGAGVDKISGLVLREGALILGTGFLAGLAGAAALGRFVESVLYGVRPLDPMILAAVTAVLGLVALAACLLPARKAARVDPIQALRES